MSSRLFQRAVSVDTSAEMQDFRKLIVWQRSMNLAAACYRLTKDFPREERFGLVSQIRRSAVSIPSNIAEGCGRNSPREFRRFLRIAYGSGCEVETQVRIARQVGIDSSDKTTAVLEEVDEIRQMLTALIARTSGLPRQ